MEREVLQGAGMEPVPGGELTAEAEVVEEEEGVASPKRAKEPQGGAWAALKALRQATMRRRLADACADADVLEKSPRVIPVCLVAAFAPDSNPTGASAIPISTDRAVADLLARENDCLAINVHYTVLLEPAPTNAEFALVAGGEDASELARLEAAASDLDAHVVGGARASAQRRSPSLPDAALADALEANPALSDVAVGARLAGIATGVARTHAQPGDWMRDPWWELEKRIADAGDPQAGAGVPTTSPAPRAPASARRPPATSARTAKRASSDPRARAAATPAMARDEPASATDEFERELAAIESEVEALIRAHNAEARAALDAPLQRSLARLAEEEAQLMRTIEAHNAQLDVERDAQDDVIRSFQASVAGGAMLK